MTKNIRSFYFLWFIASLIIFSCKKTTPEVVTKEVSENPLFTLLPQDSTNVFFQNKIVETLNVNLLMYEYLYNGGGVATADFNNDGFIDVYFTSNTGSNKLYLNNGAFKFTDITKTSKVSGRINHWTTGVTAVDINGDRKMDLYVCYSGALPPEKRKNQLFINMGNNNDGIPIFEEQAEKYGLASTAYSNQGYFFDYDRDGDLDMLLLNHNPKSLPVLNVAATKNIIKKDDPLQGVRLFKQTKGIFTDETINAGISGSPLTYGLGIGINDLNNDGWADFYISNDYAVPDYLYINNKNGTFTNKIDEKLAHTSHFSMGNDIADINNDGLQDIFTLDMLPEDNQRQKLLLWPDNYDKFDLNVRSGFHYQYMRNMLHMNNGNGTYSEVGQLMGVSNTDWSWSALLADYNNDGWKDLFVTNGFLRDYTNLDFINYMENYVKAKRRLKREDVLEIIKQMPSSNLTNYIYQNIKGEKFINKTAAFGLNHVSNSNGAAYADFDNDGDLDLVTNNINAPAFINKNQSETEGNNYLQVDLKGISPNTYGVGAKLTVYQQGKQQTITQMPARGYLSSVSPIVHFGLGNADYIDSLIVVWNDGKKQIVEALKTNQRIVVDETQAAFRRITTPSKQQRLFEEVKNKLSYAHEASSVNDFKRQPLLIGEFSHIGPCMASGDVNKDGYEDIFVGGGSGQSAVLYFGNSNGKYIKKNIKAFENDKEKIDHKAVIFDANTDKNLDIYVASAGYHDFKATSEKMQDRLYLGDGKGNFVKSKLPKMPTSTGCIAVNDVNDDGYPDIFIGSMVVPGRYPNTPKSYLLINDGKGNYTDEITKWAPELAEAGMWKDALWTDVDGDSKNDLVLVGEWLPISIYINDSGKLKNETTFYFKEEYNGFWNVVKTADFNNDGKPDFIAGNMGQNIQISASTEKPIEMYYADFDKNGSVDPIWCAYIMGESYPYLTRDELLGQLSSLRSKFTNYKSYANATITNIFSKNELENARKLTVNHLQTSLFLSNNNNTYSLIKLPYQTQYAPVYAIETADFNQDGEIDLLLMGNNHKLKLRLGQMDANYGVLLSGNGKGEFNYVEQFKSGLQLKGDVKSSLICNDVLYIGTYGEAIKTYVFGPEKS